MREIKFRLWLGGRFSYWGFIKGKTDYTFAGIPSINTETISLTEAMRRSQQFTGLHDKHGKEIYEGDIVEAYMGAWSYIPCTVEWNPDGRGCGFYLKSVSKLVLWPPDSKYTYDLLTPPFEEFGHIEIVGNVFVLQELIHHIPYCILQNYLK